MSELVTDTLTKTSAGQFNFEDPNQKTIDRYNRHADEYTMHTIPVMEESSSIMREWIDMALACVTLGDTIFEIGSAVPRDSRYMKSKGYHVICSDATENFVKTLRANGEPAVLFNVLEDHFPGTYPMIFANGVFPHFTEPETHTAFRNIHRALSPNGILAFSVKQGHGEEWITEKLNEPVFAHYWNHADIVAALEQEGFSVEYTSANQGEYPSHRWLNLIARKA